MAERLAPSTKHVFTHQGRTVYEWDQTLTEVNMYIAVPSDLRAKEILCEINKQHLKFGRQGNPPFMDVSTAAAWLQPGFVTVCMQLAACPVIRAHCKLCVSLISVQLERLCLWHVLCPCKHTLAEHNDVAAHFCASSRASAEAAEQHWQHACATTLFVLQLDLWSTVKVSDCIWTLGALDPTPCIKAACTAQASLARPLQKHASSVRNSCQQPVSGAHSCSANWTYICAGLQRTM